jgi:hypothetical protein
MLYPFAVCSVPLRQRRVSLCLAFITLTLQFRDGALQFGNQVVLRRWHKSSPVGEGGYASAAGRHRR